MKVTIAQVAEMAGVTKSTVSRYLNGGYVSEKTRKKINEVIEKTNYKPNTFARSLRAKKTNLIGVIVPRLNSYSVALMLGGIDIELRRLGYQPLIANTNQQVEQEIESMYTFSNQRVSGIILIGTTVTDAHVAAAKEIGIPILLVAQSHPAFMSITFDDELAGKMMGDFIKKSGHNHVLYFGVSEEDQAVGVKRKKGFFTGAKDLDIRYEETGFLMKKAEADFVKLGTLTKQTVVICATDNIALGVLKAMEETGQNLAVTGFGNYEVADLIGLTTIDYPYEEMGKMAAEKITEEQGEESLKQTQLRDFLLIQRESHLARV